MIQEEKIFVDEIADLSAEEQLINSENPGNDKLQNPHKAVSGGEFLKSVIFGGLDGVISTFAIVASVVGAGLEYNVVLIMGFSSLVADGLAMGWGNYLSSSAEFDFIKAETEFARWEYENCCDLEKKELIDVFKSNGVESSDAQEIVERLSKYQKIFLDLRLIYGLKLIPNESDSSRKDGLVCFFSFLLFGSIPMSSYVLGLSWEALDSKAGIDYVFGISICLTCLALYLLGALKARFTRKRPWISGIMMVIEGGFAASFAFCIGYVLSKLVEA